MASLHLGHVWDMGIWEQEMAKLAGIVTDNVLSFPTSGMKMSKAEGN